MPCGMLAGIYSLVVCAMVGLIAGCLQPPTNRDATAAQPVGSAPGQNTGTPGGGGTGTPGLSRTVAVVDDFFDLNSKVLSGKILAAYKLKCVESGSGSDVTSEDIDSMSVEALKSRLIAAATTPVNCSLLQLDPFDYNASGFTNIESSRDSWNQGILTKQGENLSEEAITQLEKVIEGPSGLYHGTATAGLVAYQNPGVKLVLIQVELSSSSEAEGKAVCHAQQTMNNLAQAYRDPDVIKATISAPRSAITDQLNQIVKQHNITVASQSYGGYSRQKTESLYEEKGCGHVDLTEYYKAQAELNDQSLQYDEQHYPDDPKVLSVKSAGNDSSRIDTPADNETCSNVKSQLLVVGSFDATRQLSSFSNYGRCVDVYSLGSSVVVAAPDNFLYVASGTSFSTPLTVRYLTMNFNASLDVDQLRAQVIAAADSNSYLPTASYPAELAFTKDGSAAPISSYALTRRLSRHAEPVQLDDESLKARERIHQFMRTRLRNLIH